MSFSIAAQALQRATDCLPFILRELKELVSIQAPGASGAGGPCALPRSTNLLVKAPQSRYPIETRLEKAQEPTQSLRCGHRAAPLDTSLPHHLVGETTEARDPVRTRTRARSIFEGYIAIRPNGSCHTTRRRPESAGITRRLGLSKAAQFLYYDSSNPLSCALSNCTLLSRRVLCIVRQAMNYKSRTGTR